MKWLITILIFTFTQILLIWLTSSELIDRLFVLITTLLVGIGYLGWVSLLFKKRAYDIPILGYVLILIISPILDTSLFSIDPLILALFASVSIHTKAANKNEGLTELFIFLLGLIYSALIGWRSAVLGFMIGCSYSVYTNSKLIPKVLILILTIILISYASFYVLNIYELLISTGSGGDPSSGRFAMLYTALSEMYQLFINLDIRAYIGNGIGAFGEDFSKTMLLVVDMFGIEVTSLYEAEGESRLHAHNFIVQNLYEFGIIGLIIQLTIIFKMLKVLKKYRVFIYMGLVSGSLSGIFYFHSEYFIAIFALYVFSRTSGFELNAKN